MKMLFLQYSEISFANPKTLDSFSTSLYVEYSYFFMYISEGEPLKQSCRILIDKVFRLIQGLLTQCQRYKESQKFKGTV